MTRPNGQDAQGAEAGLEAMESLYPFLYSGTSDLPAVLEQVRASTVAKTKEIIELRQRVCAADAARLAACARETAAAFAVGGRLFTFGNGGSATDAQQLATLFLSPANDPSFSAGLAPGAGAAPSASLGASPGAGAGPAPGTGTAPGTDPPAGAGPVPAPNPGPPALPAFCLANDTSVITALCNDVGVDVVFARQIAAFGTRNDIAVGLSTSGNSDNLVRAFDEASRRGLLTIGLAGYEGGKMAELDSIDYLFVAPSTSVHRIQEAQTTIYQVLWELTVAEYAQLTAPAAVPQPTRNAQPTANTPPGESR